MCSLLYAASSLSAKCFLNTVLSPYPSLGVSPVLCYLHHEVFLRAVSPLYQKCKVFLSSAVSISKYCVISLSKCEVVSISKCFFKAVSPEREMNKH